MRGSASQPDAPAARVSLGVPSRPRNGVDVFRFRLMDMDGADLGPFTTSEPNWKPGHRIQRGAGDSLEVVRVVAAEDGDDVNGYLVVAAVGRM